MKIILFISLLLFVNSCSSNKSVYWCGDHPCINKKEKEAYFKKTMIVEIKNIKNNKKNNYSDIEKIIEQAKLNEKKRIQDEKKIAKIEKIEEKRRNKEEKRLAKLSRLEEKKRLKEEKRLEKLLKKEERKNAKIEKEIEKKIIKDEKKQIIKKTKSDTKKDEVFKNSLKSINNNVNKFNELVENITNRNKSRPYPDINDIPE